MGSYNNVHRVIKRLQGKKKKQEAKHSDSSHNDSLSPNLEENVTAIKQILGNSPDVRIRSITIPLTKNKKIKAIVLSIDGIIDQQAIREHVIRPLKEEPIDDVGELLDAIQQRIYINEVTVTKALKESLPKVLKGNTLLLVDGLTEGLLINASKYESRSIEESESEQTIQGARDGFIESLQVNISLIRQRIADPHLHFETFEIGEITRTTVVIGYMSHIVDDALVERVRTRLQDIKVDSIESSGDIEQHIEDHPYSIFPTIGNTERPDVAVSALLDGRVIIFINGTPVCLYVPYLFIESLKNVEDYHSRPYYTSLIRIIRFFAFVISTTFPAIYMAALNFHKEMIPSDMIVPVVQAREAVPFPLTLEIIITIIMFEVIREAGVRLPQHIGAAFSIVGALILGEVAVAAGLFGAPTIIIVSISFIAAFVITPITDVTALLRLLFFIGSSLFGAYGLFVMLLAILTHMVSLTSLGVPYMSPLSPFYLRDLKDTIVKFPKRWLTHRPQSIPNKKPKKVESLPETGGKQ